jgi:hypothetical protein
MRTKISITWLLTGLALLLAAGCERTAQAPASSGPASASETVSASETDRQQAAADLPLTVAILPEAPKATDELRAVASGGSRPFVFAWEKNEERIAGQNKARLHRADLVHGDVVRVVVTADGKEASAVTVIRNTPPTVLEVVCTAPTVCRGSDLVVEPRAEDIDGDPVDFRYVWRVNDQELLQETGPVLPGDAFVRGDIVRLTVTPQDEEEEGEPFADGLEYEVGNAPPRFVASPPPGSRSLEYRYQVQVVDPDEDTVSYALAAGPDGMTIDPETGLVHWAIPAETSGIHEVRIEARDAEGAVAIQEFSLEFTAGS